MQMIIIKNQTSIKHYPLRRIDRSALTSMQATIEANPGTFHPKFGYRTLFGMLECYLDVVSQNLSIEVLWDHEGDALFAGFVGALRSESFVGNLSTCARNNYASVFLKLLTKLRSCPLDIHLFNKNFCELLWEKVIKKNSTFEYWHGWHATDSKSYTINLHLVWEILGSKFCNETHVALKNYWRGRDNSINNSISFFNIFFKYISDNYKSINPEYFKDNSHLENLINDFCKYYFTDSLEKDLDIDVCRKRWNDWRHVVIYALIKQNIWPNIKFPHAGNAYKNGDTTWIYTNENGVVIKSKFLIQLPTEINNDSELEQIIKDINESVNLVVNICEEKVNSFRKIITNLENNNNGIDSLANGRFIGNQIHISDNNLIKTFKIHGMEIFQKERNFRGIKNKSTNEAAEILAIPTSGSLSPFIYLLINEHQEITSSFLNSLTLYDENNTLSCLRKTDEGYYLVSEKRRKGPNLAEQKILLNESSTRIVNDIIRITTPIREWMKKNNKKNWNKLLLDCSKGLSSPDQTPVLPPNHKNFSMELETLNKNLSLFPQEKINNIIKKISFTSFRATKALSEYLKDFNDLELSIRLGHTHFRPELLKSYLPESLNNYFRSRSIKTTQTLIVAQAMKGHELILTATNFPSLSKLQDFLKTNNLSNLDEINSINLATKSNKKLLINIEQDLLNQLAALVYASNLPKISIHQDLRQWINFGKLLIEEAKRQNHNTTLQSKIKLAEDNAKNPEILKLISIQ